MQEQLNEKEVDAVLVYELSYLLLPSLAEEQVPLSAESLKEALTGKGGTIVSDENPVLIDLAYPMMKVVGATRHKVSSGYFGWVKFEMPSTGMEGVKKMLDENAEILRYIIIKTVRENTLLSGKMMLKREEKVRVHGAEEVTEGEKKEVPAEDIDKSIDALVVA